MVLTTRAVALALALTVVVAAQSELVDLLRRHGSDVKSGGIELAFEAGAAPTVPVNPGSFAAPLAVLTTGSGADRIAGAYAFAILAGRSGRAASLPELTAAGQSLVLMVGSDDRRARVAGARVAGHLFAAPFEPSGTRPLLPPGLVEAAFTLLNQDREIDQLAAMDALGLLREGTAVTALTERYYFYRENGNRALAGGALEALARIGHRSTLEAVKLVAVDPWAEGRDATALAVAFARERFLRDGSIAVIRQALDDKSRRNQARGYLAELGAPAP